MDILDKSSTIKHLGIIDRFEKWRSDFISDRQFVYILAFCVGFLASVAAYILHIMIHEIEDLLTSGYRYLAHNFIYKVCCS